MESISINDLKLHLEFLASDELGGRATGEKGLIEIAEAFLNDKKPRLTLLFD